MSLKHQFTGSLARRLLITLLGTGVLLTALSAQANNTINALWQQTYPDSLSDDNSGCVLCHNTPNGKGGFNPYGADVFIDGIVGSENLNSDGDPGGFTNIEEINCNAQPGWTPPLPSEIDPSWITGDLDCPPPDNRDPIIDPDIGNQANNEADNVSLQVEASDPDGDPLTYTALGLPSGLSIDTNSGLISGTVSFDAVTHPDLSMDYNVEVTVNDGNGGTDTETLVWSVADVNRDPVAVDDVDATDENPVVVDVRANDSDDDGDTLTVVGVTSPLNGAASTDGTTVTYTPECAPGDTFVDSFDYTIDDDFGGTDVATVTINVTCGDDPQPEVDPVPPQQNTETDTVTLQIVATDNGPLTYTATGLPPTLSIGVSTGLISGSVSYDAVIHPATQEVYPITVEVSDGVNLPVAVSFDWTVDDLNRDPLADDDGPVDTVHDTAVTIAVRDNDSDADGDTLTVDGITNPQNGQASTDGDTVTYEPDAGYVGPDSFDYTVVDGFGGAATATVSVNVTDEAPVAVDDVYSTDPGTSINVLAPGVLDNDSDGDGDALTAVQQSDPSNGTATLELDGSFTYTPDPGYSGPDSFTYVANDGILDSNVAMVTINVGDGCRITVDNPGDQTNDETDIPSLQIMVTNPDGDTLAYTATGLPPELSIDASTGEISGVLSYEAVQHPDLVADFIVTVEVSNGQCEPLPSVTFVWTVDDVNRVPDAVDDADETDLDTPVTVDVVANDSDPDGDDLTVTAVGDALNGTTAINNDGTVTYTPNPGFSGEDNFVYTIEDDFGGSDEATVTILVNGESDVYLNRVRVTSRLVGSVGREWERDLTVLANGEGRTQDATVVVTADVPDGVEVVIEPESLTETVVPGISDTEFPFTAEIMCAAPGSYEIVWTATISAADNSVTTNDTATAVTEVECRGEVEADVFLDRVRVTSRLVGSVGREWDRDVTVLGGGDTIEQDATVVLMADAPDAVQVEIEPESVIEVVGPGGTTRFEFEADIVCVESGPYEILWSATITADENSDSANDTATAVTQVECRGR